MTKKSLISILIILSMLFGIIPTGFSASDVSIIKDFTFHGNSAELMYSGISSEISYEAMGNDVKALRWHSPASLATQGFADISLPEMSGKKNYVFDMRINVASLTGSSTIGFLDSKETDGSWTVNGFDLTADCNLTKGSQSTTIPFGQWVRLSFVYTLSSGTIKVYVDGTQMISNWNWSTLGADPILWRFDIVSPSGSELDINIDWLRIYEGTTLLDDSYFDADMSHSIMDNTQKLEKALSGKTVFLTTNNSLYYNGSKEIITNNNEKLKYINGTLMIPKATLEKINGGSTIAHNESSGTFTLGSKSAVITPVVQNGIIYLPLTDAAQKLMGKKVSYDVRDMAIIADNAVAVRTSPVMYLDRHKAFYDYDLIYRHLLFDMPTGAEMLSDISTRFPNKTHPRVYWTEDDVDYVLSKVGSNSKWRDEYNKNINVADALLSTDFTADYNAQDSQKQNAASVFQTNITSLASAYLLTGDAKYAQKGIEMMKGFASWSTLAWKSSNLTIGHWAQGMGIGFDSFYNYMNSTADGKADIAYFKSRITALLYDDHIRAYEIGANAGPAWITYQDNFNGCIGGGMMCLLLAVCDEEDIADDSAYLLENVLRSLYIAAEVFFPDGGYYEGVTYGDMMLENFTNAIDALFNSCGTDYGIGRVPGFAKAGEYFVYLNTPSGRLNFHDDGGIYYNRFVPEFMAYRYGETQTAMLAQLSKELAKLGSVPNYGLKGLYYYDKAITDKNITFDVSGAALDKYFENIGTGTFRSSHTDEAPTYVGFHGGYTGIPHDMLDLGEFSFISDGVVWASDLGPDSYSLPSYFQKDGYKIYRKRAEGENCLVLNPKVDPVSYHGQALGESSELVMLDANKPKGAMAALDLTDAYSRDASKYVRGYYFGDDRRTLTVQDEVALKGESEAYWFMHTSADITIENNNRAILTKNGKTLTVEVYCNQAGFELKKMAASPLSTSPQVSGQADNAGYSKLAVYHPSASGNLVIAVKLSPESKYENAPLAYTPINEWSVPGGEVDREPQFIGIYANGELVPGFASGKDSYKIVLPSDATTTPTITARSDKGEVSIKQANSFSEKAVVTIKCSPYEDVTCTIEFVVSNDRPVNIKIQESDTVPVNGVVTDAVAPVSVNVLNVPEDDSNIAYITDGKFDTSYTLAESNTWVELDLGAVTEIEGVALSLKEQGSYKIMYSEDGTNFTQVYSGISTGNSGYELLPIWGRARYVRFIDMGNASLAEFCAYYPAGGITPKVTNAVVGKGIPKNGSLSYSDNDYTMTLVTPGCSVSAENGSVKIIDSYSGNTIKSQIKYNADAASAKLRYDYDFSFVGYPYIVTLKVYSKSMALYREFDLVYADGKNWRATNYPAIRNGTNYRLSFTIDLLSGEYSGTVNAIVLDNIKSGTIADLSDGVGMVELCVKTREANCGMILNDACLTKLTEYSSVSQKIACQGIPCEGSFSYIDGDYKMNILPSSCNVTYENGAVRIIDSGSRHVIASQIMYPADYASAKLRYDYNLSFVGYPYIVTLRVYSKSLELYGAFDLVYGDGKNWRASGTPSINDSTTYNLSFTVDLLSGEYSGTVNGKLLDTIQSGTFSDLSDGIGMVELSVDTRSANSGMILKGASLTELRKYKADELSVGSITLSDDNLSASVDVYACGAVGSKLRFFIASYSADGRELVAVNEEEFILKSGNNTLSASLKSLGGGSIVKAFLWKGNALTPLARK